MKKDLDWFKKKLLTERDKSAIHDPMYHFVDGIINDLNQVERPEILKSYKKFRRLNVSLQVDFDGGVDSYSDVTLSEAVEILSEYGAPVQEPELPIIPEFVAEDYERLQGYGGNDIADLNYWTQNSGLQCRDVSYKWIIKQDMETITSLLNGEFTVEEKKYYVLRDNTILLERWDEPLPCAHPITELDETDQFTEREIKDYDERYWPFAVPVDGGED